jgi:hypothetical protein
LLPLLSTSKLQRSGIVPILKFFFHGYRSIGNPPWRVSERSLIRIRTPSLFGAVGKIPGSGDS